MKLLYGKKNIIEQIENSTELCYTYLFTRRKMYFTDKLIIDPKIGIFSYKDISLIYSDMTSGSIRRSIIVFELHNGYKFVLCDGAESDTIAQIVQLCRKHNPNILIDKTKENRIQHKKNVNRWKRNN